MATETRSIGSGGGRDYSTIAAWDADLDNATEYPSNPDIVGELYNDASFPNDYFDIINCTTSNPTSITLRPATGEGHDGTEGTGARIVMTADYTANIGIYSDPGTVIDGLEIDGGGFHASSGDRIGFECNATTVGSIVKNCMVHDGGDPAETTSLAGFIAFDSASMRATWQNCLAYELVKNAGGSRVGIGFNANHTGVAPVDAYFCTVHNIVTAISTDNTHGFRFGNNAAKEIKNCISIGVSNADFTVGASCDESHNMSSDATAAGTGSLTTKTAANTFVATGASPDYHLKAGNEAEDAGTPITGITTDVDGDTRDVTTPDMGWDEFVAAGGGGFTKVINGVSTYTSINGVAASGIASVNGVAA